MQERLEKLPKIFEREQEEFKEEFNRLWHSYHAKYKIPYSYDERNNIFEKLLLIFTEDIQKER